MRLPKTVFRAETVVEILRSTLRGCEGIGSPKPDSCVHGADSSAELQTHVSMAQILLQKLQTRVSMVQIFLQNCRLMCPWLRFFCKIADSCVHGSDFSVEIADSCVHGSDSSAKLQTNLPKRRINVSIVQIHGPRASPPPSPSSGTSHSATRLRKPQNDRGG